MWAKHTIWNFEKVWKIREKKRWHIVKHELGNFSKMFASPLSFMFVQQAARTFHQRMYKQLVPTSIFNRVEWYVKCKMDTRHVEPNCFRNPIPKSCCLKLGFSAQTKPRNKSVLFYTQAEFEFRACCDVRVPPTPLKGCLCCSVLT